MTYTWITGASGYIGSSLLRARPAWLGPDEEIVLLLRKPIADVEGRTWNIAYPEGGTPDFSLPDLQKLRERFPPKRVIHLATDFKNAYRAEEAERMISSNLLFPVRMLESLRDLKGLQILNFGSFYSHTDGGPDSPLSFYAANKRAFETFLNYYCVEHGWRAITLKIYDTFGPGDPRPKLVPKLFETLRTQTPFQLSPGMQKLDLLYIDDVISAMGAALGQLETGASVHRIFQLGTQPSRGPLPSLREVVAALEKVSGKTLPVEWGVLPYRPREIMKPTLAFPTLPGWRPAVSVEEGFRRILAATN